MPRIEQAIDWYQDNWSMVLSLRTYGIFYSKGKIQQNILTIRIHLMLSLIEYLELEKNFLIT